MKLLDKFISKCIEPAGIVLKDYKKYKESNFKKIDNLVAKIQKAVNTYLRDLASNESLIEKIKYKRDNESIELVKLFSSEEFGKIVGEITFCMRVYGLKEIFGNASPKRTKTTVQVLRDVFDFMVYYTLIFINDLNKTGEIVWDGESFEGNGTDSAITTLRYMTDYLDKIDYLADVIEEGDKGLIEIAIERFDVENVFDYEVSPFPEFPSKYDQIVQQQREKENNDGINC